MTRDELIEKIAGVILNGDGIPNATLERNIPIGLQVAKLKKQAVRGLIDQWTEEVIGEPTFCDDKCANRSSTLHVVCVDVKNELIAEQRKRAGLPEKL